MIYIYFPLLFVMTGTTSGWTIKPPFVNVMMLLVGEVPAH